MSNRSTKILFLTGAGASASFWKPVAEFLGVDGVLLSWPGLGNEPRDPDIAGMDDLVRRVLAHMREPVDIVAQSMGGYVAIRAALAAPGKVRRLVLTATSAGVPMADLGAADWRPDYTRAFPDAAQWIAGATADLSVQIKSISAPALLIWGGRDPISPVGVGQRLLALLPDARLEVIAGADHDVAKTHADVVAGLIGRHLAPAASKQ